jgi:cytochrome c oxidase cbb3-type subunit 4
MSLEILNLLRGIATILAMAAFIAVFLWSWSRRRRDSFDAAARLPLEEDPEITGADREPAPRR